MNTKYLIGKPFVVVENGMLLLYSDNGSPISGQVTIKVTDDLNELVSYQLTGICNVVGSKEEMLHEIAKQKPKEKVEYPE